MKHRAPSSVDDYIFSFEFKKKQHKLTCKLCPNIDASKSTERSTESDVSEQEFVFESKRELATHLVKQHTVSELLSSGYDIWNFIEVVDPA